MTVFYGYVNGEDTFDQRAAIRSRCAPVPVGITEDLDELVDYLTRNTFEDGSVVVIATSAYRFAPSAAKLKELFKLSRKHHFHLDTVDDTFSTFSQRLDWDKIGHDLISCRTKFTMAAAKSKGKAMGRPRAVPDNVLSRILREADEGVALSAIARGLNNGGIPTPSGGKRWYASTISYIVHAANPVP